MQGAAMGKAAESPGSAAPILEVDEVTLQYKTQENLVTATYMVSFEVHRADRFVLLGTSGCGKSTMPKGVGGFMRPVSGVIRLNGKAIHGSGPDRMLGLPEFDQPLPCKTETENIKIGSESGGERE